MRPVTKRQARALRAVAASALTTLLAATAHTLGGGGAPAPGVLVVATVLAMPVALAVSGRAANVVRTALAVVGAQAVYHVVFAVFGMSVAFSAPAMQHMHAVPVASPATTASGMSGDALMGLLQPGMLAMHAAAAIVTTAILAHGERILHAIAGAVWPRLLRRMLRPRPARATPPIVARRVACAERHVFAKVRRRGPPAVC